MRVFRGFKKKFDIVGNDNGVQSQLLPAHDLTGLCNFLVKASKHTTYKTIFDVGANIGLSSLLISEVYPSAHTFAFEPLPKIYQYLLENLDSNYATGFVTPVCSAVGGAGGSVYGCLH